MLPGGLCTGAMPGEGTETDPKFLGSHPPSFLPLGAANDGLPWAGRRRPPQRGPPRRDRAGLSRHCHQPLRRWDQRCRGRPTPRPAGRRFTFVPALLSRHVPDTKPRAPAKATLPTCARGTGPSPWPQAPGPGTARPGPHRPTSLPPSSAA